MSRDHSLMKGHLIHSDQESTDFMWLFCKIAVSIFVNWIDITNF